MKTICISGLDKSGKHTQVKLLEERLSGNGYKVIKSDFPNYTSSIGNIIRDWLTNKIELDNFTIELLHTADKQSRQKYIEDLEFTGVDFLILDRYILDQIVYASANGMDIIWTATLQRHMRKPDLDIVIDIPAEVSMNRKGKHNNGENDRYESDLEMLKRVRDNYITLSEKYSAPLKYIVEGTRTIEDIHEDIYSIVIDNLT